jgi:hypothetical protein
VTGNLEVEVRQMGQTIAEALIDEGRLLQGRTLLRLLLEKKVGPLPEPILQQLEAIQDIDRISQLVLQADTVNTREDLHL